MTPGQAHPRWGQEDRESPNPLHPCCPTAQRVAFGPDLPASVASSPEAEAGPGPLALTAVEDGCGGCRSGPIQREI